MRGFCLAVDEHQVTKCLAGGKGVNLTPPVGTCFGIMIQRVLVEGNAKMHSDFFEVLEIFGPWEIHRRRIKLAYDEDSSSSDMSSPAPESRASLSRPVVFAKGRVDHYLELDPFETHESSPKGPPPWFIGFSKQFKKDTDCLDRKLLGRVLEALEEISGYAAPLRVLGDTFKPLSGELQGCWRYRIGDHRLVVKPAIDLAQINALTLAARGSAYD